MGVQDVCQHLALDLRAFRGDPVVGVEGEEENLSGEGRLQGPPCL